jgi:predicted transcriptional regulator
MLLKILIAGVVGFGLSGPALAQVALNQNDRITESLVAAQAADMIRKTCSSISARYIVVYQKMGELEDYARAEGYTEDEVRAFLKDKTEKARIKALAQDYLTKLGVVEGDEESFCQAGRDEIAAKTLAGSLLSSWK